MTYDQALMVVRNAPCYNKDEIEKAAALVLGTLDASEEDFLDAGSALGYADLIGVEVSFARGARCSDIDAHPFSGSISDY